jgi:alanine dehydrogenase
VALLLRNTDLVGLMPFEEYVAAVEAGYRESGSGRGSVVPRTNLWIEGGAPPATRGGHLRAGSRGSFKFKGAFLPGLGAAGLQAYTAGLPAGLQTFLFLFDTTSGALSAVMEVLYYDWLKTAAVAAVATKHLAPDGAHVAALIGTGRHARSQLHALVRANGVRRVQVYGRDRDRREAFCASGREAYGVDVVACATAEDALRGAQIVTTITTSPTPVFDGTSLPDHPLHVNAMGAHYPWVREIDEYVVTRSRIVLDDAIQGMQEEGEVLMPIEAGVLDPSDIAGDLGAVVAGRIAGRTADRPWTLFLSGGTGVEDVAVATRLVEIAREKGVGSEFEFGLPFTYTL